MTTEHADEWVPVPCDPAIVPEGCNGTFILVRRKKWGPGDSVKAADVRWPDGRAALFGEEVRCGACGRRMHDPAFTSLITAALKKEGAYH